MFFSLNRKEKEGNLRSRKLLLEIAFWLICLPLTLGVVLFFVHTPGIEGMDRAYYGDQVYAHAHRPFVLRALTPFVVRNLVKLVPDSTRENLEQLAKDHKKPYRHKLIYLGWNPDFLPEYFVGILYMWVSLLAFVWIFRRLMRETIETYHIFYLLIPILAVILMPAYFAEYYCYLYDFPHLFLFTLGLYFLASRNWTAFLILYPISCLNKETTVLLTVIYLIHFGLHSNLSWRKFGAMLVYQGLVYLTIRTWLMHVFQDLPGGWVEHHFWRNVSLMQTHTHLFYALFGIWFVLATTMPYRWNRKPQFLRDAFWIGFILLPLDLFCGYLDELRTNYEVYPVALLLVVFTLGEKIGWMTAKDRRSVGDESQTDHSSMPSQVLE